MNRRLQVLVSVAVLIGLAHATCAAEPGWPNTYFLDVFNGCPYPVTVTFSAESKATVPANTHQRLVTPYTGGEQKIKFEADGKPIQEVTATFATLARGTCYYGRRVLLAEKHFVARTVALVKPELENVTFFDGEWSLNKSESNLLIDYPYDSQELTIESRSRDEVEQTLQGYRYSAALAIEHNPANEAGGLNMTLQPDLVKPFLFRGPAAVFHRSTATDGAPVTVAFKSWIVMTIAPGGPIPQTARIVKPRLGDITMVNERLEGLARAPRIPIDELLHPLSIDDDDARRTAVDELTKSMSAMGFAARITKMQP